LIRARTFASLARLAPPALLSLALLLGIFAGLVAPPPLDAQYRGFGKNKVRYDEFDWQIYHSPHFDVYYYTAEEPLLDKVVSFAESAYDQLSREFDSQIQEPTPLIFYKTHSDFEQNNVILNFIPEGVAAFASPVRNRMVLPVDMPDPELMGLLLHELTHIFQYHILFQGSLSKAATLRPPQWFMEGMASYMAKDEESHDTMVLRDAVVNDIIPSATEGNVSGYFAYRFGHAVFDYIEERWGREGFLDFIYEYRNTIGARTGRALERAFRIDPEDFDLEFRRWLRKKYLQELVETGEPSDFGRPFRTEDGISATEISPAASPSGDLLAAISIQSGDVDLALFDTRRRRQIRNLTRGYTTRYEYLVVQGITVGRRMGRDLAFSPDGNYLAAFARRNEGRNLLLFDVLKGGIARTIEMDVEQQLSPTFSPDGKTVAFAGNRNGVFDIFLLDLDSEQITPLTDDPVFDGAPVFSPDGRSLVFSSVVGAHAKLFRIDLDDPSKRYQITEGESNDKDAVFSPDGSWLYYTSDRNGYDNIFGLNLESGELYQYTDVITGCFMPTVVSNPEGRESLAYAGLWKGRYRLYRTELDEPVGEPETLSLPTEPATAAELPRFEPAIEVTVDDANKEEYHRLGRFFLTDAQTYVGVDDNQTFLGTIYLAFSDYLGDKRIIAVLSSYDALSNFNISYWDLSKRLQWGVNLFDDRDFFFVAVDPVSGQVLDRRDEVRLTGARAFLSYPFGLSSRAEAGVGYAFYKIDIPRPGIDPDTGQLIIVRDQFKTDYPFVDAALVGDSAIFAPWGPVSGRRWRLDASYAGVSSDDGGPFTEFSGDYRQYFSLTQRSSFAVRLFAGVRDGTGANPFRLGGDTIRGFPFRSLSGDRAAFLNAELRFPLLDLVATPVFNFQGIQGRIFLDVGAVWYDDIGVIRINPDGTVTIKDFEFWNSDENRLEDGIATYGWGFTVRFLGLDLNWDFAKRWDFNNTLAGFQTTFYIGTRF